MAKRNIVLALSLSFSCIGQAFGKPIVPYARSLDSTTASSSWFQGKQLDATQNKFVIAHNMLIFPTTDDSVDGYKADIILAQSAGIDGFALNVGGWPTGDIDYQGRADRIFEAAQQLNSSFKLCFSADMTGTITTGQQIISMITRYASHPNTLFYNNRQVFTTFRGESTTFGYSNAQDGWTNAVIQPLENQNNSIFFIGNFWISPDGAFEAYPVLDGIFQWLIEPQPNDDISTDLTFIADANKNGKTYMAAVTPWYAVHLPGKNWFQGNYDWCKRWEDILSFNPNFVEIVTWNDFSESTYVGSWPNALGAMQSNQTNKPHEAFLRLGSYYVQAFKDGSKPTITKDQIFYYYRLHSQNAKPTNDPLGWPDMRSFETMEDVIYVVTFLTSPGAITITSGSCSSTFPVNAGITKVKMAFSQGNQTVTLQRGGEIILTSTGKQPISDNIVVYNFNVYADWVGA